MVVICIKVTTNLTRPTHPQNVVMVEKQLLLWATGQWHTPAISIRDGLLQDMM
jgi:hypothetical protein